MMLLQTLPVDGAYRELRLVLRFLTPTDAAALLVVALESDLDDVAQWIFHGDAPIAVLSKKRLVELAACHACWRATAKLIHRGAAAAQAAAQATIAPSSRYLEVLQAVVQAHPVKVSLDVLKSAVVRGDLEVIQWLLSRGALLERSDLGLSYEQVALSMARDRNVVDWMVTNSLRFFNRNFDEELQMFTWSEHQTCTHATTWCFTVATGVWRMIDFVKQELRSDHDPVHLLTKIRSLRFTEDVFTSELFIVAPRYGRLTALKWFQELFPHMNLSECMTAAARAGHLEILQLLFELPVVHIDKLIVEAAEHGKLTIVRWIFAHQRSYWNADSVALRRAASRGHFDVLRFLVEECVVPMDALTWDICYGSVDVCKYIMNFQPPREQDVQSLLHNAAYAKIDVLKYLVMEWNYGDSMLLCVISYRRDVRSTTEPTRTA